MIPNTSKQIRLIEVFYEGGRKLYIPSFVIFIAGVLVGAFLTLVISIGAFKRRIDNIIKNKNKDEETNV